MSLLHLETPRLLLRPFVPDDAPVVLTLYRDPEVVRFMGAPEASVEDVAEAIRGHRVRYYEQRGMGALAGIHKATNELVGRYSLQVVELDGVEDVEITYLTAPAHRRRGFAEEAARALLEAAWASGLSRIVALIAPDNVTSQRLIERLGFRFERDTERVGRPMRLYGLARPGASEDAALRVWGWDEGWEEIVEPLEAEAGRPGRVVAQDRERWSVQTSADLVPARTTPGARLALAPVVGDWVLVTPGPSPPDPWTVTAVLPRRSSLSRGAAGTGRQEQVLAANVDVVWVVHGLDAPLNTRRVERYLAVIWESGAVPELVLTKSDLCPDLPAAVAEAERVALGVQVRTAGIDDEASIAALRGSLRQGGTVALVGPSGVGKSTLVNLLSPAAHAATGAVREKDLRGRHTTTRRELYRIDGGALLLDTPGIRELRLWAVDEGLDRAFPDIEELAASCRFRDCRHESEPGCAVLEAERDGRLSPERVAGYRKLRAEAEYQARKADPLARKAAVAEHKTALKTLKHHPKYRREDEGGA